MKNPEFFKGQDDTSFENYLEMAHENWAKDSLASVHAILKDYVADVKMQQRQQNPRTSRVKTVYKAAELKRLVRGEVGSGS